MVGQATVAIQPTLVATVERGIPAQASVAAPRAARALATVKRCGASTTSVAALLAQAVAGVEQGLSGAPGENSTVPGPQGRDGTNGKDGRDGKDGLDLSYVAGAVISGETALEFARDGTVVPANPNKKTASGWIYAGIATAAAQPGEQVNVRYIGDVAAPWWTWTFGLPVFAGANGALTQQPPATGYQQTVGLAISPTSIRLIDEDVIYIEE